jgi:hypothetical protein
LDFQGDRDATPETLYSVADRYRDAGKLQHTAYVLKMHLGWASTHGGQKLGELFGEMAFIKKAPRMASAITITDAKIIRIQPEQLVSAVAVGVLQKIFENMARRIWFAYQPLAIFRIDAPQMRMYAYLYNLMRNQNLRTQDKEAEDHSYRFEINYAQLESLSGILQLKGSSEGEFLANENLLFEDDAITVPSRKTLADQISVYRARTGQIIAETK